MDLTQRISKLSPEQRSLLEFKLKQKNIDISQLSFQKISPPHAERKIEPVEKEEYYPLSVFQKRFYILNLFVEYSLPLVYQLEGNLDRIRFEEVFQELIKRHESFRTSIEVRGEEPVQEIHEYQDVEFKIEYYETDAGEELIKKIFRPFDLTQPPLLRVRLIKLSETSYLFSVNIHHLIADGFSWGILTREIIRLYKGEKLPELKFRYKDFSQWQNQWLKGKEYKKQEEYWLNQFPGQPPVLDLQTDYPRPPRQNFQGRSFCFEIAGKTFHALKALAAMENASFFMVLLTILNTLLFRYTPHQQEDIVIGTIIAGREQGELQNIIGLFINTLALRNTPAKNKTIKEFLKEMKHNTLKAYENQLYPFGDLLEKVVKKKDLSRNPLFDVMVIYQNRDIENLEAGGLRFVHHPEHEPLEHAQQDITLWVWEEEERITINLEYCTALFKPETMERFALHFMTLLRGAAANPGLKLSELEMTSEKEKRQEEYWLGEFSGTLPVLDLPIDYERPALHHFEKDNVHFKISPPEVLTLKEYAKEEKATMFMVVLTLFNVFLSKLSGQQDIIIGTPAAGQRYSDLYNNVDVFINSLSLRNYPQKDKSFQQLLGEVRTRTLEAFENRDYPFDDLVKKARMPRDSSRNPIFSVLYSFVSREDAREQTEQPSLPGANPTTPRQDEALNLKNHEYQDYIAKMDLILTVSEINHTRELLFNFGYCTKLFKKETSETFITYFKEIISAVVKNKRVQLKEIKISLDLEEARIDIPQIEFGF
jgi:non-ribosomal peptide synthetase component F